MQLYYKNSLYAVTSFLTKLNNLQSHNAPIINSHAKIEENFK